MYLTLPSNTYMKIHQISYVIFETISNFSWHNSSVFFFQTFGYFNESSPNSSCNFWNHKVRVCLNFASLFSPMKDDSSVFFYSGQKYLIEVKLSDFWVVGWKFTKIFMSYLRPQVNFSLKFASLFSVMRNNSSVLL